QKILRLQRRQLIEIANHDDVTPANRSSRDRRRQGYLGELPDAEQTHRRDKIEADKGAARIGHANFEQKSKKRQQQPRCKPANQYFTQLDARLGAIGEIIISAAAHSQNMDKAGEQPHSAKGKNAWYRASDGKKVSDPPRQTRSDDNEGVRGRQNIGHRIAGETGL